MHIDDTDTNPAAGDTETVDTGEEVLEPGGEAEGTESEAPEGQTEEELEEIEREGKKARIPKWLKPELMMQADYTRKTQEVAEARKAYEARQAQLAEREKQFNADTEERVALHALTKAIEQYENINWAQLEQQNWQLAQSKYRELNEMRNAAGRLQYGLEQKAAQRQQESERERANRLRERDANAAKMIPGFNPALLSKIHDYATSDGYTAEEVQSIQDARFLKTLNEARLWREHQAKAKAAAATAKQQEEPVPSATPTVSTRKPPERLTASLAKENAEKWIEMRNKQLAARRGR